MLTISLKQEHRNIFQQLERSMERDRGIQREKNVDKSSSWHESVPPHKLIHSVKDHNNVKMHYHLHQLARHVMIMMLKHLYMAYLFWTQAVCCIHEMAADHRKDDAVTVLSQELHALFELVLKQRCVETTAHSKVFMLLTKGV